MFELVTENDDVTICELVLILKTSYTVLQISSLTLVFNKACISNSMTSLLAHTVAQPTKWIFLLKNLNQLVIFVIGLVFT